MPWVRVDDHFDEHPKIAQLDDHALALFVCSLAYCNRNLTDGFIPHMVGLGQLRWCEGNTTSAIRQLEDAGLWEQVDGGWQVHDYEEYQPSRADVLADRCKAAERQARRRHAVTHGPSHAVSHGVTIPVTTRVTRAVTTPVSSSVSSSYPVPVPGPGPGPGINSAAAVAASPSGRVRARGGGSGSGSMNMHQENDDDAERG